MAIQAKVVDRVHFQHVRVRAAVRHVACGAAIDLHRLVFVHKRPLLIPMALEAHRILCCSRARLLRLLRAVGIMAIGAPDDALVYPVMVGHLEQMFLRKVAG